MEIIKETDLQRENINSQPEEISQPVRTIKPSQQLDGLFRQTRLHHTQLSAMADVKASMMLTLSSLIITFSIGYLVDPILRWAVVVLIFFCILTILSAAYAVMPKLDLKNHPDPNNLDKNFLFFGNFINYDYETYREVMERVISDDYRVYEMQIREIYEQGLYLGRKKYLFIRYAFLFFITGLICSAAVLILTFLTDWALHVN